MQRGSTFYTNQEALGFHNLFRGIVTKNWLSNNTNIDDYKYNKILVYECVTHYHTYWIERCKIAHDEEKQRVRLINWYHNLRERTQKGDLYHLKRYIDNRKLNLGNVKTDLIREWIRGVLKMEKVTALYKHQDIRNWFVQ